MSLTVLIDEKLPQVGIVRWFKDPRFYLFYPSGPLVELSSEEFRQRGCELVRKHFEEIKRIPMAQEDARPVFGAVDEKKYLRRKNPIQISSNPDTGDLHMSPMRFRSYSLGRMESYAKEDCKILLAGFTEVQFWEAFDAVRAEVC